MIDLSALSGLSPIVLLLLFLIVASLVLYGAVKLITELVRLLNQRSRQDDAAQSVENASIKSITEVFDAHIRLFAQMVDTLKSMQGAIEQNSRVTARLSKHEARRILAIQEQISQIRGLSVNVSDLRGVMRSVPEAMKEQTAYIENMAHQNVASIIERLEAERKNKDNESTD